MISLERTPSGVARFRFKLLVATALIAGGLTFLGVIVAERYLASRGEREVQELISHETQSATHARAVRQAVLEEICERLARQPRIHAALEDNALDLLYPSARNELRHLLASAVPRIGDEDGRLQAIFYRFLDQNGRLIRPATQAAAGIVPAEVADELELARVTGKAQQGYFAWQEADQAVEVFATPVVSTVTFKPIAMLLVGFPFEAGSGLPDRGWWSGLYSGGKLSLRGDMSIDRHWLEELLARSIEPKGMDAVLNLPVGNSRIRLIARPLNPDSSFPAAHEVFVASLSSLGALQARSRLQIIGAGAVLFLIGLAFSHTISSRFSRPVEALAEESENQRVERLRAETRLEETSEELRRAARFSADASHQLKTPVSVMRVGLEELLNFGQLKKPHREEVQSLIRQTDRLTQVIDDLLLLSRMDSGGLKLTLGTQQLKRLVEALVDDLSMLPDAGSIELCLEIPEDLYVRGDRGYTMQIFQCALENAWKYNRPGGRIVIRATRSGEAVSCRIGNTGRGISAENQAHIFDRFHRATLGEDVPGYGLGLNLARDLAQLHGGDLRLLSSAEDWTEFEVLLRAAAPESGERT